MGLRRQAKWLIALGQAPRGRHGTVRELEYLWVALEARNVDIRAGRQKRDVMTPKSPNLYSISVAAGHLCYEEI